MEVPEHQLGWTDMASEDHSCSLEGAMPEADSGYLVKQNVNVPFGQFLSMKVEWDGLDLSEESSLCYSAPEDTGCKILKAMACRVCGMEKVIDPDPMPEWNRRVLYHRNCYFPPRSPTRSIQEL